LAGHKTDGNVFAINEIQLILAEKRTSLAVMRTGIAVLALPLSVISLLIVTSKYYDALRVLHFLIPIGCVNLSLIVLGSYLVIRSTIRIRHYDHMILKIKQKHSILADFID